MKPKILFASLLPCFFALGAPAQTQNLPGIPIFGAPPQQQIAQGYTGTVNPIGNVTAGIGSIYIQQSNGWYFEFLNTNSTISGWGLVLVTTNGSGIIGSTNANMLNGIPGTNYAQLGLPGNPTNNGVIDTNSVVQLEKVAPDFFAQANRLPIADEEDDFNSLGVVTITSMSNHMMFIVTNGLNAIPSERWIQVSDAVLTNLSGPLSGAAGRIDYYPPAFPLGGSNFVAMCHSNNIKVFQYVSLNTFGSSSAGNPAFPYPQSISLADCLITNLNVDGVFFEGQDPTDDAWQVPLFLSEFVRLGHPIYTHTPGAYTLPGTFGNIPASDIFQPFDNNWVNSHYANVDGGPDPTSPNNWTNFITHFKKNLEFAPMTRPGHWLRNYYIWNLADGSPLKRTILEAAAAEQGGFSYQYSVGPVTLSMMTNADFIALWQDRLMMSALPVSICATNGGLTNWVFAKPLETIGGPNALAFFLWQTNSPLTLSSTNLGFNTNVFSLYSPWSHAVEAYATNTFTLNGTNQQSFLYKASQGIVNPGLVGGTNLLGNLNFRLNNTNGNSATSCGWIKNGRACNGLTIEMNGTFYSNGVSSAGPAYAEYPLANMATNFNCVAGIDDVFAGQAAVQWTFYTNGVQAFQSGWITNAAQDTNVNFSLVGVWYLGIFVNGVLNGATDASWEVGDLGNAFIMTPGNLYGTFIGNGDQLNFQLPLISSVVVSSNMTPLFANDLYSDRTFTGTSLDTTASESPVLYVNSWKLATNTGTLGDLNWMVPRWATNCVSKVEMQWSGNCTNLTITNDFNSFVQPTNGTFARGGFSTSTAVWVLTNGVGEFYVTNSFPTTNCDKYVRMLSGTYGTLTNCSASPRVLRVDRFVGGILSITNAP